MIPTPRVMLLIDADNVSADVIEQAVQRTMDDHGAIQRLPVHRHLGVAIRAAHVNGAVFIHRALHGLFDHIGRDVVGVDQQHHAQRRCHESFQ